ncbi:hypothetical protein KEM56_003848 [Ascosphaera pollenicola]|nr:hypothetical protein KEM56_003848 [Ascosphaera pollenicola]
MEKNVMRSLEQASRERMEVARQISEWGETCDDDVSDVTDKIGVLLYEIAELEDQMVDRYDQYRLTLKSIRNIEKSVQPSRDRKQKITDEIAKLKYKEPNSQKLPVLEQELVRAEAESLVAEAQLSNITREKVKAAFSYQMDSIREQAEKEALIAGYAKLIIELIDDSPITPGETRTAYDGYEASKAIIQDCENALTQWAPSSAAVKPALSIRTRHLSQRKRRSVQEKQIPEDEIDRVDYRHERPMSVQSSSPATSSRGSQRSWRMSSRARQYQDQQENYREEQEHEEFDSDGESQERHSKNSRPTTAREYNEQESRHESPEHHQHHHDREHTYEPETDSEDEHEPEGTERTSHPHAAHQPSGHVDNITISQVQESPNMAPAAAALAAPAVAAV